MAVFLLVLAASCAGETQPDSIAEPDSAPEFEEARSNVPCVSTTASIQAHMLAGRVFPVKHFYLFQRMTTYHARGTNELLGLTRTKLATLYQLSEGRFSQWPLRCRRPTTVTVNTAATVDLDSLDAGTPPPEPPPAPPPEPPPAPPNASRSPGCGQRAPIPGPIDSLTVGNVSRAYILALPTNYNPARAYPLVFAFHGLGSSAAVAQQYFGLEQAAFADAIRVYPEALPDTRAWGITGGAADTDLAFFDALQNTLENTLCVDRERVFATGHSMGAFFTNTLGCARGRVLRGIAPVAGGGPFVSCDDGEVAAMLIAARDDTVVSSASGEASRDHWLRASHCAAMAHPVTPSICMAYENCAPGYPVHWCLEPSGGHEWPSYAGGAIWNFFQAL